MKTKQLAVTIVIRCYRTRSDSCVMWDEHHLKVDWEDRPWRLEYLDSLTAKMGPSWTISFRKVATGGGA